MSETNLAENLDAAGPFVVRDCALIALATGHRAQNLRELRDGLLTIDAGSIYYHFWGSRLRARFDDPEYNNDFAAWVRHALHDWVLAERLAVVDPTEMSSMDELRQELIEVIEERLEEQEIITWSRPDQQFNFLTSQIVVFDTHRLLRQPQDLVEAMPAMTRSSVFYHFIDARRRHPEGWDDFRSWLDGRGDGRGDSRGDGGGDGGGDGRRTGRHYKELCQQLADIDPFFSTLAELRDQLADLFMEHFGGRPA